MALCEVPGRVGDCLLLKEGQRRQRDFTWRTWLLSLLDSGLRLGYLWFRTSDYVRVDDQGLMFESWTVRRTLAGYTIPWGRHTEFYEDGAKSCTGMIRGSAFPGPLHRSKYKHWLPGGEPVDLRTWLTYHLGPEAAACAEPAWEKV